jgi:hypothetical protein
MAYLSHILPFSHNIYEAKPPSAHHYQNCREDEQGHGHSKNNRNDLSISVRPIPPLIVGRFAEIQFDVVTDSREPTFFTS